MALTKSDLEKIGQLMDIKFEVQLNELHNIFVTKTEFNDLKEDVNGLKDDVAGILYELRTEHRVRQLRIEDNTERIGKLEKSVNIEPRR